MNIIGITYSASFQATETTQYYVNTAFFGGTWYWYGFLHDRANGMAVLEQYRSDTLKFWMTSEEALADAIHHFTGDSEDGPEDQAPDFTQDDYPGEVLPAGWDAQDHKALYE